MKLFSSNLSFSYNEQAAFHYPSLRCDAGETLLITGKSGCGKTTLLHIVSGLLRSYKGDVLIDDTNIARFSNKQLDTFRGSHIGIVFQRHHFIDSLTVIDNILLASYLSSGKKNKTKASALASALQIQHLLYKMPSQLSQGEQQRVSIARSLINEVSLVLADEPTSSLDDDSALAVAELLQQQAQQAGAALVIVTHDERLKQLFPNTVSL